MQDKMQDKGFNYSISRNNNVISPYLNFDPSILNPSGSSQFIIPEGQGETRSKMEYSFSGIGGAVGIGGLFGGVSGLLTGINETKNLTGKIRYSQLMNFGIKRGSMSAQSFGCLALLFSLYDWGISSVRNVEDELNTVSAGVLTGITYTSPHGLKRMAYGGGFGLGLTLLYLAYNKKELIMNQLSINNNNNN